MGLGWGQPTREDLLNPAEAEPPALPHRAESTRPGLAWPGGGLPGGLGPQGHPARHRGRDGGGRRGPGREEPACPPAPARRSRAQKTQVPAGQCSPRPQATPWGPGAGAGNRAPPPGLENRISWPTPEGLRCGEAGWGRLPLGSRVPSPSVPPWRESSRVPSQASAAGALSLRPLLALRPSESTGLPWPGRRWARKAFVCWSLS